MDWKDQVLLGTFVINVVVLIYNSIVLFLTWQSSRRQWQATDVHSYFQITEKLTDTYRRYGNSRDEFDLVEVLNLLESLSRLYFKRRIHGVTRDMVKESLLEIIRDISCNDHVKKKMEESCSSSKTYEYIRCFARSHDIKDILD